MKTKIVVYDSVFGNTEQVARSIAEALSPQSAVEVVQVSQLSGLPDFKELLVVGSPTRGFKPTPAITAWLQGLPENSLQGVKVAAFDTRVPEEVFKKNFFLRLFSKMVAYAASAIAKELSRKGGRVITLPAGFYVLASEGPLVEGELERAKDWAGSLDSNH